MSVLREATVLAWLDGYKQQRYVRHMARGDRTLCGQDLGGQIPDPPDFDPAEVVPCTRKSCRDAAEGFVAPPAAEDGVLGPDMAAASRASELADRVSAYQTARFSAAVAERLGQPDRAMRYRQDARDALTEWPTVLGALEGNGS
jgi:hypothetical protein